MNLTKGVLQERLSLSLTCAYTYWCFMCCEFVSMQDEVTHGQELDSLADHLSPILRKHSPIAYANQVSGALRQCASKPPIAL